MDKINQLEGKVICFKGLPEDFFEQTEKLKKIFEEKNMKKEELVFILETLELQEIKAEKSVEQRSSIYKGIFLSIVIAIITTITILLVRKLLIL
ncbi:hypothetical protein [Leptotrichia wadei]|uniref:hypothetical protein n=1 Tax=Leptotrichia wadei TaxID=157687 RepID=UPI0028E9C248|nr:hypothetical protein [Leptotrichia wadei]